METPATCLIRGRCMSFQRQPHDVTDVAAYVYHEDGAILIRDGMIAGFGPYDDLEHAAGDLPVIDHRPHLILPGFIDAHNHMPQIQVIGSYGAQLLDWLNTYTFPAEIAFANPDHARRITMRYFDEMLRNGTTTPVAFCTSHPASVDAYFEAAAKINCRAIGGKVMMDRNAPDALCDTPQRGFDETNALIETWHGTGRALYAISPRFALTSTEAQLEVTRALAQAHCDCYIQTHLSENKDEIAFAARLFPDAPDYLGIYQRYDLVGPKTLLGHAIHLTDRETGAIRETGAVAVHCPTSNLFIGSGLFDYARMRQAGIRLAVATDIGGGTSCSMLRTLDEAYKIQQLQGVSLDPLSAFYMATRGNAEALGLHNMIGTLDVGSEADLVVLDCRSTPVMALRSETISRLEEELFVLQTMGDDRSVAQTYVAGISMKPSHTP